MLTKQASEQQQQLLQRAIVSQVSAAATVAAANARTSLSQLTWKEKTQVAAHLTAAALS